MSDTIHVVPGDQLSLTISGKIADPGKANTADAVTLRIFRPRRNSFLLAASYQGVPPPAVSVDTVFEPDAKIDFNVTSRFKNGVHIDADGRYWMRRPDGWHEMSVAENAVPSIFGTQFAPREVQRLREDK